MVFCGVDVDRSNLSAKTIQKCKSYDKRVELANSLTPEHIIPEDKGFLVLGNVFNANQVVKEFKNASKDINLRSWPKKKLFIRPDMLKLQKKILDSEIVKLALNENILSIVSEYMNHVPLLLSIRGWQSQYVPNAYTDSQLYHCDWEDIRNIKMFVHISDITEKDGVLTAISAKTSQHVRDKLGYTYSGDNYRVSDDVIYTLGAESPTVFTGSPGTVALVDTCRCFHYGSRVEKGYGPRTVAVIQYISPAAINLLPVFKKKMPFSHLYRDDLSELQKFTVRHGG